MSIFEQYIDGEWTDAVDGGRWDLINPATELVIQQVPFGGRRDVELAIDAAWRAFASWSSSTPYERGDLLHAAADIIASRAHDYAKITTEESGKPFAEALAEWKGAPNYLRWAAEEAKRTYGRTIPPRSPSRRIEVSYHPIGVVGSITAWNFPVYNVNRVWSSALAAGCTVVSRPSEYTPRSAMLLAEAVHDAGVPPGVANIVSGDPAEMGQAMLDDQRLRKIQFTGSTRVGKLLLEGSGRTVTRLSLELGGNAPVLVFADAGDIGELARHAINAKYRNCGQVCVSPQRFYVHEDVVEEFTAAAVDAAKSHRVGDGLHEGTTVGPLINATQLRRVERIVAETVEQGARILHGGKRSETDRGYFFEPTVIADVAPGSPLHDEEVFGPVLPIIPFRDADDAVRMANSTEYGLAAYVHTRDLKTAMKVSDDLDYGLVAVNDWVVASPEAPFGGTKQSGMGRESGPEGLHEYLEPKTRFFGGLA